MICHCLILLARLKMSMMAHSNCSRIPTRLSMSAMRSSAPGVGVGVAITEAVGVKVAVTDGVGVRVAVTVRVAVGVGDKVGVTGTVAVAVGVSANL
jgi:hypothetical protein